MWHVSSRRVHLFIYLLTYYCLWFDDLLSILGPGEQVRRRAVRAEGSVNHAGREPVGHMQPQQAARVRCQDRREEMRGIKSHLELRCFVDCVAN